MSQAESAYTTSPSIVRDSPAIRRRQLIEGGTALLAAAVTGTRSGACAIAFDAIHAAIEVHRRAFCDLRALLAEQDATDCALRSASKSNRLELETRLAELCKAEGPLGRAATLQADSSMSGLFGPQYPRKDQRFVAGRQSDLPRTLHQACQKTGERSGA